MKYYLRWILTAFLMGLASCAAQAQQTESFYVERFENFYPRLSKEAVHVPPTMEAYLATPLVIEPTYSLRDRLHSKRLRDFVYEHSLLTIKDTARFVSAVFRQAQVFGYAPEEICELTPRQAIWLATRITNSRLLFLIDSVEILDYTGDSAYFRGYGHSLQYSIVLMHVLGVFRNINENLTNLYCKVILSYSNGRAWNEIIAVNVSSFGVYYDVVYVDPFMLDVVDQQLELAKIAEIKSELDSLVMTPIDQVSRKCRRDYKILCRDKAHMDEMLRQQTHYYRNEDCIFDVLYGDKLMQAITVSHSTWLYSTIIRPEQRALLMANTAKH